MKITQTLTTLVVLAIVGSVTAGWPQTPTPTPATTIYVSDRDFGRVLKFDSAGQMTVFLAGINWPSGLTFDNVGNLYVATGADTGGELQIIKRDPLGGVSVFASGGLLVQPIGIACNGSGDLYVANGQGHSIVKIDSFGQQTVFVGPPLASGPLATAIDTYGNVYVTDGAIRKFDPSGNLVATLPAGYAGPAGLAFDAIGNLYVSYIATPANWKIEKFNSAAPPGMLFASTLVGAWGIALDALGNLYAAEAGNNTIERFNPAGEGEVFASAAGQFVAIQEKTTNISGNVSYCSNPSAGAVLGVRLQLTGDTTGFAMSNDSGDYMFSVSGSGGSYDVTPSKAARLPGSTGINTVDVIATQRHFLNLTLLTGCRLLAADVNGDNAVNTSDVIAIKRFYLGLATGIANTGKYRFIPATRSYLKVMADESGQTYDALVFGDVASPYAEP